MALCTTGEAVSVRNQIRKQVSRDRVGAKRTQRNGSWRRSAPFVFVEGNCFKGQEKSLSLRPLLALHCGRFCKLVSKKFEVFLKCKHTAILFKSQLLERSGTEPFFALHTIASSPKFLSSQIPF